MRPANEKEIALGSKNIIKVDEALNQITLKDEKNKHHNFECDFIITDQLATAENPHADTADSQQQYVYECAGKPLLDKVKSDVSAEKNMGFRFGSGLKPKSKDPKKLNSKPRVFKNILFILRYSNE